MWKHKSDGANRWQYRSDSTVFGIAAGVGHQVGYRSNHYDTRWLRPTAATALTWELAAMTAASAMMLAGV